MTEDPSKKSKSVDDRGERSPEEVEATRREPDFRLKSVGFQAIRYDDPAKLFDYLDLMMGIRMANGNWFVPSKSDPDPRYPEGHVRDSPEGMYTSIIVPQYHKGKFVYIIGAKEFDKIREKIEPLIKEAFKTEET